VNLSILRSAIGNCGSVVLALGMVSSRAAQATLPADPQEHSDPAEEVQQARQPGIENTSPSLKLNPSEALRRFQPAADEEYTLGAGDEISVQFPGRPELATRSVIGPDGRITLPLAGTIVVANLTRAAAGEKITSTMSKYFNDIAATVEVMRYGSNHVTLMGNVNKPGAIEFSQTPTLLEVLSRGGVETGRDGSLPDQCVIYRGDQVFWVDLHELLMSGSPLADLRLRRDDLIFVPGVTKTVTVIGQVPHPGQIPLRHDSTLTSILGEAGGISDFAGNDPNIEIVHRSKGTTQYVRLKNLLKQPDGMDVSLHPGDVIFVPRGGVYKWGFVLQQISPYVLMGSVIR
jgi:polysaccharide export outer membrane protein